MQQVPLRYSVREGALTRPGNVIVTGEPMVAQPTIQTLSDYMSNMGNATPRTRAVAQSAIRLEPKQQQQLQTQSASFQAAPSSPYGLSVGPVHQAQRQDTVADWYPPSGEQNILPPQAIPIAPSASQVWTFQQPRVAYANQQPQQAIHLNQPMMQIHHQPSAQVIQQAQLQQQQQQQQPQQQAACTSCAPGAIVTTQPTALVVNRPIQTTIAAQQQQPQQFQQAQQQPQQFQQAQQQPQQFQQAQQQPQQFQQAQQQFQQAQQQPQQFQQVQQQPQQFQQAQQQPQQVQQFKQAQFIQPAQQQALPLQQQGDRSEELALASALNRNASFQQQQYLSEQLMNRPPLPQALLDDIVNFKRSRLNHVQWPIYAPQHFYFAHMLRPLGSRPLPAELLQEIRMCGGVGFLRPSPKPCTPSLRFRLGPKFHFANYTDQRAAFLAGKPSTESASVLSRDRDYEHGRPASIADRVKDVLRVGHTGPPSPRFRGDSTGQRSTSWPRYAGIGSTLIGKIKHTLGLDKPTIDASYYKPEEAEVNYSASSGLIPTVKSTVTSVTVSVKDKLSDVTDAIKSTVSVAGDVVKETLGLSSQAATDSAAPSWSADATYSKSSVSDTGSMYSSSSNEIPASTSFNTAAPGRFTTTSATGMYNRTPVASYASVASSKPYQAAGNTDPAVASWSGQRGL